jgi:hypothetical protein
MRRTLWLPFFCAIGLGVCLANEALPGVQVDQRQQQKPDLSVQLKAKLRLVASLPNGLKITHSPNPTRARIGGRSRFNFTWPYTTSVQTINGSVTIEEFGAFAWENGRWVFSNLTDKPYSAADFSDWYSCPQATLLPGRPCTDAHNWSGRRTFEPSKTMWYVIGVNAKGIRVKGVAVVRHLPEFGR